VLLPDGSHREFYRLHHPLEVRFVGEEMVAAAASSGASSVWNAPWDGDGAEGAKASSSGRQVRACRAVLALRVDLEAPSSVATVAAGVHVGSLDPELLPTGLVGAVGVSLDTTDITGLRVRPSAASDIAAAVRPRAEPLYALLARLAPADTPDDSMASLLTGVAGSRRRRKFMQGDV
jgi:hypothetical protein